MSGKGYKIVYVQESPPRQVFTDPKSRNGNYTIWRLHKGKPIADVFLTPNLGKKLVLRNVRAKLPHYGITSSNLCVSCGDMNVHAYSVMAPNVQAKQGPGEFFLRHSQKPRYLFAETIAKAAWPARFFLSVLFGVKTRIINNLKPKLIYNK
jgi:hypothetical protein